MQAEWWYAPSSELGGDAFGYQFLDETTLSGFLIDVSGHGVGAALLAANVANVVRRRALVGVDFRDPAQVAAGLNAMFPMEEHGGLMLTLWCFTYDVESRNLRFCSAGHHPALLVAPEASDPAPIWRRGPAIGMLPAPHWDVGDVEIEPGSRLYVFSDGPSKTSTKPASKETSRICVGSSRRRPKRRVEGPLALRLGRARPRRARSRTTSPSSVLNFQ